MTNEEFSKFCSEHALNGSSNIWHMRSWENLTFMENAPRLCVMEGPRKGVTGRPVDVRKYKITLDLDGGPKRLVLHYSKLARIDANGEPILPRWLDMTGRELKVGELVAFAAGQRYASLYIGQIEKLNPAGGISVIPKLCDGQPLANTYRGDRKKTVNNPDRTLKLPIDDPMLVFWMLTEFKNLKENAGE